MFLFLYSLIQSANIYRAPAVAGGSDSREMTTQVPALWGLLTIRQGRLVLKQIMVELQT